MIRSHTLHRLVLTSLATGLLGILLGAGIAVAQTDQTGALRVGVVDADGAALPGVRVDATRADGDLRRVAVTDAEGRALLTGLLPGDYDVSAQLEGFATTRQEGVAVNAGSTVRLSLELSLGTITEAVTVTAEAPLIDAGTTEQATILGGEVTETLPISRTATDLVKFTPGGTDQALWGGSTDQANSYQLDGVSVNQPGFGGDFLLPNVDWIEEFQVKGLGAGAEYGGFQGGLVNIVTKSGDNQFKGGVRLNYEDDSLNSSTVDLEEAGFEDDSRFEANANVSGPLVSDSLFYFLSYQQVERDTKIVDDEASTQDIVFLDTLETREEAKALAKLNWQATDSSLFSALVGWDDVETENRGLDSFTEPEAATTQDSPAWFYNLSFTDTIGNDRFYELKLSGYDGDDDRLPKNGDTPAVQLLGGDRDLFENAVSTRLRSPSTDSFSGAFDWYFSTGAAEHQLKLGFDYEDGSWLERRIRNGGLTWRPDPDDREGFDPDDPSTWGFISSDWGGDIHLDADTVNAAAYVQDYVDLTDRVRLSAGLRFSQFEGELTPGFGGGATFQPIDEEAVDPRLGVVADLSGDGDWVGKIHWGRYHQSLFALLFDRAAGGNVFQDLEFWDWIGPGLPDPERSYSLAEREQLFALFDVIPTGEEVGPVLDYEQPFVDQLVVSLEHSFLRNWKVGLTYVNRENDEIVALVDRNLGSNYTFFEGVSVIDFRSGDPILDEDGNPLTLPGIWVSNDDIISRGWAPGLTDAEVAALSFDQDLVITNTDARREMDQVQLELRGRGTGFDLSASVVYTDLVGDFFSVSGYDDPGGVGAGSFVEPNLRINDFGRLRNVNEWEAKVRLSGDLPWGLRGGVYALWASGDPFAPRYVIDNRNHDFVSAGGEFFSFRHFSDVNGESIFLEDRGSREHEDYLLLDVHLDKAVDLGNTELVLGIDVFNLLNDDAARSVVTTVNEQDPTNPSTLFGAPVRRLSPRTTRLYLSLRF